jgi:hypothetical protein
MEYKFTDYLLAKQSVDDRALNKNVLMTLQVALETMRLPSLSIIEAGGGIGTMLARLLRWEMLPSYTKYTLVDSMPENIEYAQVWLPQWAESVGLQSKSMRPNELSLYDEQREVYVQLICSDIFDFINSRPQRADLLIAHAFLDLLPLPDGLLDVLLLSNRLAWLTLNFDGVTIFEPVLDPLLDEHIMRLYHKTMNERPGGGDSQSGRHLFSYLVETNCTILDAGASDWVVYPGNGHYQPNDAYFLHYILHFIEESLTGNRLLDPQTFKDWLTVRHSQIERGELTYIAHQMDFLAVV